MDANDCRDTVEKIVWVVFQGREQPPTDEELKDYISRQINTFTEIDPSLSSKIDPDELVESIAKKYKINKSFRKDRGYYLYDTVGNEPWVASVKSDIDWHYWNQYREYLLYDKGWSSSVVGSTDLDTEKILDFVGNPNSVEKYKKKGLVIADVQSGKTSNYIGVACRAADAGYRYIIIIASITNDLRYQTQKRVEEGFIGIDYFNRTSAGKPVRVGVGDTNKSGERFIHPNPGTTRESDFKKAKMKTLLQIDPDNTQQPWVFVIKKNPNTLKNLIEWFKSNNHSGESLLLIDDEADTASINIKYNKNDISTINGRIRELLNLFDRATYLGYTATPFANVLIDPDEIDEVHGSDLFPRNFIYVLNPSSAYFGAKQVFEDFDLTASPKYLRFIHDVDLKDFNRSDFIVTDIPTSMKKAIDTFVIASTIRVLRNQGDTHTTMLVNSSAFNNPQRQIQLKINEYLSERICMPIKVFAGMSLSADEAAKNSSDINRLRKVFFEEYADGCGFDWDTVFRKLYSVAKVTHTALINCKSQDALGYEQGIEHVIAIGGNRLSRGLTLEGLIVSYFARNSRAYDTLMQMARWFGYRVGYEDLCRIWMTEESAGWCAFVSDASQELMDDCVEMNQKHMTPLQYGHKIKAHPGVLMVTARNKMGSGKLEVRSQLSGRFIETTVLKRSEEDRSINLQAASVLLAYLEDLEYEDTKFGLFFSDVPSAPIRDFLLRFRNSDDSPATQDGQVARYVDKYEDNGIRTWDVLVAKPRSQKNTSKKHFSFNGSDFPFQRRMPGVATDSTRIYVGNRYKVSTKGIEAAGLSDVDIQIAEARSEQFHLSLDKCYREMHKRPLLIIHHLDISFDPNLSADDRLSYEHKIKNIDSHFKKSLNASDWPDKFYSLSAIGYSVSFPELPNDDGIAYVFTKSAFESMNLGDDDYDEDFEDGDDE